MSILYYVHDPMCSWCWGFRATWQQVTTQLPKELAIHYLVGGLAPDSNEPMPLDMQRNLPKIWQTIQEKIPGTKFNYDFWTKCQPRRSTYIACRAVLAAKTLDKDKEYMMIQGIQEAYYLNAKNPSDIDTLEYVAVSIGLDKEEFSTLLSSQEIEQQLHADINKSQQIGANGFPSLVMEIGKGANQRYQYIPVDYNNADRLRDNILALL